MAARLKWLGHATVLVETGGTRLLTDPVLRGHIAHLRRRAPIPPLPAGLDAVLLSHLHHDHADWPTLRRIPPDVPVFAPPGTTRALTRRAGRRDVHELRLGNRAEIAPGTIVRAVPARHDGRRWPIRNAPGTAFGYVIESEVRVYFAGDTSLFDGMTRIGDADLDLALLPIAGWGPRAGTGHLDHDTAAEAVRRLRPRLAIPIHWGTYLRADLAHRHPELLTSPGPAFAAEVRRRAPEVRTVLLAPGQTLDLEALRFTPMR